MTWKMEIGTLLKTTHKLAAGLGFSTSGFLQIIERRIYGIDKEYDSSDF